MSEFTREDVLNLKALANEKLRMAGHGHPWMGADEWPWLLPLAAKIAATLEPKKWTIYKRGPNPEPFWDAEDEYIRGPEHGNTEWEVAPTPEGPWRWSKAITERVKAIESERFA